ncbi:MAG: host-nuclease inhibitor Gam family protein [Prosthecobacter sp.]|nr:host-nuclease inhibitor Gam family protein [Prosthecobacter sp.]
MAKDLFKKLAALVPQNDEELAKLLTVTTIKQAEREKLVADRNTAETLAKAALEKEHSWGAKIATLDKEITGKMELLETWSAINKPRFGEAKSLTVNRHRFGWRLGNWKTTLRKGVKSWKLALEALHGIVAKGMDQDAKPELKDRAEMAKDYLAIKLEANKEAMLRDRDDAVRAALLNDVGVIFDQDENFFLEPDREQQQAATLMLGGALSS